MTSSSVDRMEIYAELGVPEVWRVQDEQVSFWRRTKRGKYVRNARSRAFPMINSKKLTELLCQRFKRSENQIVRQFVEWLRQEPEREGK